MSAKKAESANWFFQNFLAVTKEENYEKSMLWEISQNIVNARKNLKKLAFLQLEVKYDHLSLTT